MAGLNLRALALALALGGAAGFAPPARAGLPRPALPRPAPRALAAMNIFEKAASGAAAAIGKGVQKMAGMPELSEEETAAMEKAMLEGTLNFDQFLMQMRVITKAGSVASFAAKIPGVGNKMDPRTAELAQEKLRKYERFCGLMTAEERANPTLVLPGGNNAVLRVERIAKEAGVPADEVKQFLGEFVVMRKTSQAMAQGKSPAEVEAAMMGAQDELGLLNRAERRLNAKEKKGKPKSTKGFGAAAASPGWSK